MTRAARVGQQELYEAVPITIGTAFFYFRASADSAAIAVIVHIFRGVHPESPLAAPYLFFLS
ncbi:hypothetical protein [Paraburkholderia phosphatilytica]|uniref:hypothetical protein n=1 Tax=Paraburkholderia phosphatilytica TaxID=2282883 RepID=UPI000F5F8C58|nr:hypothetical protein [Paraburkholderia phosphatilytica]